MNNFDASSPSILRLGGFHFDLHRGDLFSRNGVRVDLRPRSFAVLKHLGQRHGEVVAKSELMNAVWDDVIVTDDSLTQCIADIRRAIGDADHRIVRNVPRRGYLLVADELERTPPIETPVLGSPHGIEPTGWPSVAVLPFSSSAAVEPEWLTGEGLAGEVIAHLSRNGHMRVIARESSFALAAAGLDTHSIGERLRARYLVSGAMHRGGDRIFIDVQLIDARDELIVWSQALAIKAEEIPAQINSIVEKVATAMHGGMEDAQERWALARPPRDLDTFELTLRGKALLRKFDRKSNAEARSLLEESIRRDPDYSPAWVCLAWTNSIDALLQFSGAWSLARSDEIVAQFERSLRLDPRMAAAYRGLSSLAGVKGDAVRALALIRRAVNLAPSDADNRLFLGLALLKCGEEKAALIEIENAVDLNPVIPPFYLANLATALWANERYSESLQAAEECLLKAPEYASCEIFRIISLVGLGREDEAKTAYRQALRRIPKLPVVIDNFNQPAAHLRAKYLEMARKAGWDGDARDGAAIGDARDGARDVHPARNRRGAPFGSVARRTAAD